MKKIFYLILISFITLVVKAQDELPVSEKIEMYKKYFYYSAIETSLKNKLVESSQNGMQLISFDSSNVSAYFTITKNLIKTKDFSNADYFAKKGIHYATIKKIDTKDFEVLLVDILINLDKNKDALNKVETLIEKYSKDPFLKVKKAEILTLMKKQKQALALYSELEKFAYLYENCNKAKIKIYIEQEKYNKAEEIANNLIANDPSKIDNYLTLIDIYNVTKQPKKIKEICDNYTKKFDNIDGKLLKAKQLEIQKEYDAAYNAYIEIINSDNISQDEKFKIISNSGFKFDEKTPLGSLPYGLLKTLANKHTDNYQAQFTLMEIYKSLNIDSLYYKQIKKVAKIDSTSETIYQDYLFLLGKLDKNYEFDTIAKKCTKLFPNNGIFFYLQATSEMRKKQWKNAIEPLIKSEKLSLGNNNLKAHVYSALADCYYNIKDTTKMIDNFELALNIDPLNALYLNNYSYYLATMDFKLDKAEQYSRQSIASEPDNSIYLDTYAYILFKKGNYAEALKNIEKAISTNNNLSSEIFEHYGDILFKIGKTEDAINQWKKAKTMEGATEKLNKKIEAKKYVE